MPDARWVIRAGERKHGDERPRVYDDRDRDDCDPRDGLMHDLDLPRGEERELVVDRDRVYELDGEDSRTLAAVGVFRVVPEHDLDIDHHTLAHLRDEGLVETVDLGAGERGLTLTREGRDLLDSHSMDRDDEPSQAFYGGVSREREIHHDSSLYATYRQEETRLRDEHNRFEIRRVVLEQDDDKSNAIPISRCRELLGEEADSLTDQEVTSIRRHAETMAWILVEIYSDAFHLNE